MAGGVRALQRFQVATLQVGERWHLSRITISLLTRNNTNPKCINTHVRPMLSVCLAETFESSICGAPKVPKRLPPPLTGILSHDFHPVRREHAVGTGMKSRAQATSADSTRDDGFSSTRLKNASQNPQSSSYFAPKIMKILHLKTHSSFLKRSQTAQNSLYQRLFTNDVRL